MAPEKTPLKVADVEPQSSLPDEVLKNMVSVLRGEKSIFLKKAKLFRQRNADRIILARYLAEKGLLKEGKALTTVTRQNQKASSDIGEILKSAKGLQSLLAKIPDLSQPSHSPLTGLVMRMDIYFHSVKSLQEYELAQGGAVNEKLQAWADFQALLSYHIRVFEEMQSEIAAFNPRGRPNTVKKLEPFIECIAEMYSFVTNKKFTVCEYGDVEAYTEGMLFAQQAMEVLRTPSTESHCKYKDFLASRAHTAAHFESACDYARKALQALGKNKKKKG